MTYLRKKETCFWAVALLVTALLASVPLFSADTLISGPDTPFHMGRIEGIREGLLAGQFPVRVNPVQLGGYGMPTGIFYPDIFLYFPAFLRLAGVSLLASWKAFLVLVNLLTAFVGWWAFSVYTRSKRIGAVAALFYTIFIFRLGFLYIVTAVAENLAMAFLPAALVAIWVTIRRDVSYWPSAAFFSSCVLLSHVLSSIFLIAATLLIIHASLRRFHLPEVRRAAAKAVGFIFLLTIWFYAPFLYFYRKMDFLMKSVTQQEVWYQMIFPWRDLDFYIGSSLLLLLAGLTVFLLFHRKRPGTREFWILFASSAFIVWLISHPKPWHIMGAAVGFIQTPFRLIEFPAIFLSVAVAIGIGVIGLEKWRSRWCVLLVVLVSLGANFLWLYGYTYSVPPHARQRCAMVHIMQGQADAYFLQADPLYATTVDYMDRGAYESIVQGSSDAGKKLEEQFRNHAVDPQDRIWQIAGEGNAMEIRYREGEAQWIRLPLFWYMGYAAQDADSRKDIPVRRDEQGRVSVLLPPSAGHVRVWYDGLPWFSITDLLSWFSLFGFFYVAYRSSKEKHSI